MTVDSASPIITLALLFSILPPPTIIDAGGSKI
jgi:hypothetical protein